MTAQQAREASAKTLLTNSDSEYQSILKNIEQESKIGKFELLLLTTISTATREKLESDGFKYSQISGPTDYCFTAIINW